MKNEYPYKGHRIRLLARKMDNGKWSCAYTVVRFGKSQLQGFSDYAAGDTGDDSKTKALSKAKKRIDLIT